MKRFLRGFMIPHRFFGLYPARGIAGLALLGRQRFASIGDVFGHGDTTPPPRKGSRRFPACAGLQNNPMQSENFPGAPRKSRDFKAASSPVRTGPDGPLRPRGVFAASGRVAARPRLW